MKLGYHEKIARIILIGLLVAVSYILCLTFQPFLDALLWATFFATAFYPLYNFFRRRLKNHEWISAIFTTFLIAVLLILPSGVIVFSVVDTLPDLLQSLEARLASGGFMSIPILSSAYDRLGHYLDLTNVSLQDSILSGVRTIGQKVAIQATSLLQNIFQTLIAFIVMIVVMSFLLRHGEMILKRVQELLPLKKVDKDAAFSRLRDVTRAIFYGVLFTALIQALLGTLGWAVVGLPTPIVFGIMMFFCAMIPVGGTALIWGPGAAYLILNGSPGRGIALLLWGFLVVGMLDNFIRPIFISKRIRLHMIFVYFGILGGIMAFGIIGLFIGPLAITMFLFLLDLVRRDLDLMESHAETTQGD